MLTRRRSSLTFKARLKLVNALILSKLTYGISIWGNISENWLKRAHTTLNKASIYVTGDPKTTRIQTLMKNCNWLDVQYLTQYHSLMNMLKIVNWKTPKYINDKISSHEEGFVSTTINRLQITGKSFRWNTVKLWNSMKQELRERKKHPKI